MECIILLLIYITSTPNTLHLRVILCNTLGGLTGLFFFNSSCLRGMLHLCANNYPKNGNYRKPVLASFSIQVLKKESFIDPSGSLVIPSRRIVVFGRLRISWFIIGFIEMLPNVLFIDRGFKVRELCFGGVFTGFPGLKSLTRRHQTMLFKQI